ncbi:MAG TPA: TetR/AcrR family transcriptional regulator C-terminal domain-containing protein [Streptosporangiaceae bacterium]|nr:TetR/AcrR family transcriptional regulator C-terminal domain-containing protein [Streptosporangiaceae bacterium]
MAAVTTARRTRERERLTRDRVLRAALDFVDAHGLAALSMPKLGAELGVKGMSLYSHVDSKDALLDGIVEIMSAETEMPPAAGTDWRDALRSLAGSLRAVIRRHPAAAPLLASRAVMPIRRLEVIEGYLHVLRAAGFGGDCALDVLRTVYVYAQGYALAEVSYTDVACGPRPRQPDDELARMRRVTQMVPRDAPDRLVRLAMDFCGRCDMDDQFNHGVDLMIRGLEASMPH